MKVFVFTILAGAALATGHAQDAPPFKNEKEKASYAVGLNLGNNWKRQEIELDFNMVLQGLKDTLGEKQWLTEQETRDVLTQFQQEIMAKQQEKRRLQGEKNKTESEAFLAANKTKPGVMMLGTNGLQYKVITEGSGETPQPQDTVTVKYRGTLVDGTEFDSSEKAPGGTATFRVNGVIRGWTEALTHMKAGSKWQLYIPSDLAYGERGSGQRIGPNAALIFDVELVSVQPAPPPAQPTPLTSDIIKVPSLEEMKKGAKIETIKAEDVEKLQKEQEKQKEQTPK